MTQHFEQPDIIIVPAASVVVLRRQEVLLVRRGKPPANALWSFPGGKLKPGEKSAVAAVREAFEETSLIVTLLGQLGVSSVNLPAKDGMPHRRFEITVFTGTVGDGRPMAGDDAELAKFIPLQQVDQLAITDGALSWIEKAQNFQ